MLIGHINATTTMAISGTCINIVIKCFVAVSAVVTLIVVVRTVTWSVRAIDKPECKSVDPDFIKADANLISRFQQALKFKTVSTKSGDARHNVLLQQELIELQHYIIETYKTIHSSPLVTFEVIANYSLLYSVKGSNPDLKPFLLMGHLDVVPVEQEKWDVPAFEGLVKDGFIYGRGTIDDKQTVFGILEAVEFLLSHSYKPKRSFYMAFGHDEEVRGFDGAKKMAQVLTERETQFEFIIDEGMTIVNGMVPGLVNPVALIGTSEKGSIHMRLTVNQTGGHSSMPERESCIGILSAAVNRLESNTQPSMFGYGPEKDTFEHLAPYMKLPLRAVMANLWLFGPLVSIFMSRKPSTNALLRTTTAVTQFHAGIKDNVIPTSAQATVNHRVHPGQTLQDVIEYDRQVINDERVNIEVMGQSEPHPISPSHDESFGFQNIKSSILQVWKSKNVVVAPGLMIANTDTVHYLHLSKSIYRFAPTFMYPDDLKRFHGHNERISVENYQDAVNFYYHLIVNSDTDKLEAKHEHGVEL